MAEVIEQTLRIEIAETDNTLTDNTLMEHLDYRAHLITRRLIEFVYEVTDDHAGSPAEAEALRFMVAMKLLLSFQMRVQADALKERVGGGDG